MRNDADYWQAPKRFRLLLESSKALGVQPFFFSGAGPTRTIDDGLHLPNGARPRDYALC
jgi:hypothetical protein